MGMIYRKEVQFQKTYLSMSKGAYLVQLLFHQSLIRRFFETTQIHGMFSVYKLLVFPPRNLDIPGIGHHDIIATINWTILKLKHSSHKRIALTTFVVYWLVLAHEYKCYSPRKFS